MFCPKCGTENKDGNAFCQNCGADMRQTGQAPGTPAGNKAGGGAGAASQLQDMARKVQGSGTAARVPIFYITAAIAAIQALMPFMKWFEIPSFNSLSSFLGGSSSAASFSLFGLLFNGGSFGSVGGNAMISLISLLLCLFAFLGSVFDIIYIAKGFPQKKGYYKYGKIASVMLLIISLLFAITFGLVAAASSGAFKVKAAPWIVVVTAIANLILIGQVKRAEN